MKRRLCIGLCLLLLLTMCPISGVSEGEDAVRLARVLYTLCRDEDEQTMMKVGSVIMNRVDSPWFPDTLSGVLNQAQQFPGGRKYDVRALQAALRLMDGVRELAPEAVHAQALDATQPLDEERLIETSGGYGFYR